MKLSGQLADYFKGAIYSGEENEATDASEVLRTDGQLLPSSPDAIQRPWHLHLTELAMSGQFADHFTRAIDFGEEDEATDPSEVLPTCDQLLLSTPGAI